jgi:hypothetical protein
MPVKKQMLRNIIVPGAIIRVQALAILALGLALAGCAEFQRMDTGVEPSAREQIDACLNSCERDHSICMESASAQRSTSTAFGAAQECDRGLSACFQLCRGLGDQPARF